MPSGHPQKPRSKEYDIASLPMDKASRLAFATEASAEARRRLKLSNPKYEIFKRRYYYDWAGFVIHCIDWSGEDYPADYQLEILSSFNSGCTFDFLNAPPLIDLLELPISEFGYQEQERQSARGPHGLGKTAIAAWLIHAFALTTDGIRDWKIGTTASRHFQLNQYLWPEIRKWATKIKWNTVGRPPYTKYELFKTKIELTTGQAFSTSPGRAEEMEGMHGGRILFLFDEAKIVHESFFNSAEGAFATAGKDTSDEAYAFAVSTPGEPSGAFYKIHSRSPQYIDWKAVHITPEQAVKAGRISGDWINKMAQRWGKESSSYKNRVLGEFAASEEDSVIPTSWIEAAEDRWREWQEEIKRGQEARGRLTTVGGDVAEGGKSGDNSVIAPIYNWVKVDRLREVRRGDEVLAVVEMTEMIAGLLSANSTGNPQAIVDAVGVGLGTLQNLRARDFYARAFKSSFKTDFTDASGEMGFVNWRCAMWWIGREMLHPDSGLGVCLPPDGADRLKSELAAPKWKRKPGQLIWVENKQDIRDRFDGNSTDAADAVLMGLVGPLLCDELDMKNGIEVISYEPIQRR